MAANNAAEPRADDAIAVRPFRIAPKATPAREATTALARPAISVMPPRVARAALLAGDRPESATEPPMSAFAAAIVAARPEMLVTPPPIAFAAERPEVNPARIAPRPKMPFADVEFCPRPASPVSAVIAPRPKVAVPARPKTEVSIEMRFAVPRPDDAFAVAPVSEAFGDVAARAADVATVRAISAALRAALTRDAETLFMLPASATSAANDARDRP
jgi:hypothetical protein